MKSFPSRLDCRALVAAAAALIVCVAISGCSTLDKLNPFSKSPDFADNKGAVQPGKAGEISPFVSQTKSSYVRLDPIEAGAQPNDQPIGFTTTQIRAVLAMLKLAKEGEAVFNDGELDDLAAPLAAALSRAGPREDVVFAVSGKHGTLAVLHEPVVTSGRFFYKNGALNIIFGEMHTAAKDQRTTTGFLQFFILREFPAGSRNGVSKNAELQGGGSVSLAVNNRRDWVQIAANGVPAPLGVTRPAAPAAAPAAAAGAAPTAPAAGSAAAPAAGNGSVEQTIEQRLTVLKSLRDKGLITEQEYDDKRKEILKSL